MHNCESCENDETSFYTQSRLHIKHMKKLLLIGFATVLLAACNKPNRPPLSLEEVKALICGRYEGDYAKGMEYFEIRSDDTFSQTLVQSGVTNYTNEGKWSFEKLEDRYLVTFKPFMDLKGAISDGKNPKRFSSGGGTFYDDEPRIYFSRDLSYFILKRSDEAGTNKVKK